MKTVHSFRLVIVDALISRNFCENDEREWFLYNSTLCLLYIFRFFCYTLDHLVLKLHFFHSFLAKTSWLILKLGSFLAIVVDSTVSRSYSTLRKSETCFWQLISIMAFRAINFPRTKKASLRIFRRLFLLHFSTTFIIGRLQLDLQANEIGHPVWRTTFFFHSFSYILFFVCLQFFYLVTETYKMGGLKEMQRWAYEIFSCYLVPDAPLRLSNLEHSTIEDIDRYDNNNLQILDMMCKLHTIRITEWI